MITRNKFLHLLSVFGLALIPLPTLSMNKKRNVGIFIFDDAEVLDFAGPFEVFSVTSQLNNHELFNVFTISKQAGVISAVNGLKVQADYHFQNHPTLDILILAGGQGTRALLNDPDTLQWISKTSEQAELTLCICSAARLLGKLGLLNGKHFCTHHEVYDHVKELAPAAVPQPGKRFVQTSEKLYTSGGISAGIDLSFHVVEKLFGKKIAQETAEYMEYHRTVG
jgi:transcriptional regulator GlxA family with amidase domain